MDGCMKRKFGNGLEREVGEAMYGNERMKEKVNERKNE